MIKANRVIEDQNQLEQDYRPVEKTSIESTSENDIKKGRFSKYIIISMFGFLFVFVSVVLYLFMKTGNEPSTLVSCVFAFCSVEGGALALIKTIKTKKGD